MATLGGYTHPNTHTRIRTPTYTLLTLIIIIITIIITFYSTITSHRHPPPLINAPSLPSRRLNTNQTPLPFNLPPRLPLYIPLSTSDGSHYVSVSIGTPPQRVSLILDTGSHHTAFPCKGCTECGKVHMDDPFDVGNSGTATWTNCEECADTGGGLWAGWGGGGGRRQAAPPYFTDTGNLLLRNATENNERKKSALLPQALILTSQNLPQ